MSSATDLELGERKEPEDSKKKGKKDKSKDKSKDKPLYTINARSRNSFSAADALGRLLAKPPEQSVIEADAEEREALMRAPYTDDLIFDNARSVYPDAVGGKYVLLLSMFLQACVAMIAFVSHHYKSRDYNCCNMWAVLVCLFFILYQITYLQEWFAHKSSPRYLWHRGNMFVPFIVFVAVFWVWGLGSLSMIAHSVEIDIFLWVNISNLTSVQMFAFIICSITCVGSLFLLYLLDAAHRNNVGFYYYYADEHGASEVYPLAVMLRNHGSFENYVWYFLSPQLMIHTPVWAEIYLPRVISATSVLQMLFYIFICIAYKQNTSSNLGAIVTISFGLCSLVFTWQYWITGVTPRSRKTRKWNRTYMGFPMKLFTITNVVYFITMANMFFSTSSDNIYQTIPNMDSTEKGLFGLSVIVLVMVAVTQYILYVIHRSAWANARDDGRSIKDPLEERKSKSVFGISLDTEESKTDTQLLTDPDGEALAAQEAQEQAQQAAAAEGITVEQFAAKEAQKHKELEHQDIDYSELKVKRTATFNQNNLAVKSAPADVMSPSAPAQDRPAQSSSELPSTPLVAPIGRATTLLATPNKSASPSNSALNTAAVPSLQLAAPALGPAAGGRGSAGSQVGSPAAPSSASQSKAQPASASAAASAQGTKLGATGPAASASAAATGPSAAVSKPASSMPTIDPPATAADPKAPGAKQAATGPSPAPSSASSAPAAQAPPAAEPEPEPEPVPPPKPSLLPTRKPGQSEQHYQLQLRLIQKAAARKLEEEKSKGFVPSASSPEVAQPAASKPATTAAPSASKPPAVRAPSKAEPAKAKDSSKPALPSSGSRRPTSPIVSYDDDDDVVAVDDA